MMRRELVALSAGAATILAVAEAKAQQADAHAGHHHDPVPNQKLVESSGHCIETGRNCMRHCLATLATGDTSLAGCAQSVNQLIAACNALQTIAADNSPHLKLMATAVAAICDDCEKECRKHADRHDICGTCANACRDCAAECRKL